MPDLNLCLRVFMVFLGLGWVETTFGVSEVNGLLLKRLFWSGGIYTVGWN